MEIGKKKLIFVITQPVVGGAQKYVFDLAKNFSKNYHVSVAIGEPKNGDLFQKLESEKIESIFLRHLKREIILTQDFRAFFELVRLFKKEKPDIIHLNSSKAGLLGSLAGFFAGIGRRHKPKIIFTAHGWIFKEDMSKWKKWIMVTLEWLFAKFKDRIICVSKDDFREAMKHYIAPPRKLSVVYNSIDKIKFLSKKEARAEISKMIGHEIGEDTIALVNLGRLYATKGLNYLMEAVSNLGAKHLSKKIVLVIFGDGPERENIKNQISSLRASFAEVATKAEQGFGGQANLKIEDTVFLVGDVPDAAKYLPAFDALVLSSTKEGFPYAILEAGLAGIPVISTNVGGVGEIIKDGENGILIEPKNPQAISDAIKNIIGDDEKSKKLSAKLKKSVAEDFSFEEMAERTEWVYKV